MPRASLEFLCASIADALLAHYDVKRPPVPVAEILQSPPPSLAGDLSLTAALPFGDALWLRLLSGQGAVFVRPDMPDPERRYAIARAMFAGLCSSAGGAAAGLPAVPNADLQKQAALFARSLLMPTSLLPPEWAAMPLEAFADLFGVPLSAAELRRRELAA